MRLYRTPSGRWWGTQADARAACLDEAVPATGYATIEVPTDKPGLLDWLHLNCGPATVEAARAEAELDRIWDRVTVIPAGKLSAPPPIQPPPTPAPIAPSLTDVEAFIQQADHRQLTSLFENIMFRSRELLRDRSPAGGDRP